MILNPRLGGNSLCWGKVMRVFAPSRTKSTLKYSWEVVLDNFWLCCVAENTRCYRGIVRQDLSVLSDCVKNVPYTLASHSWTVPGKTFSLFLMSSSSWWANKELNEYCVFNLVFWELQRRNKMVIIILSEGRNRNTQPQNKVLPASSRAGAVS